VAIGTPVVGTKDEQSAASATSTPAYPSLAAGDCLVGGGVSGAASTSTFSTTGTNFAQDAQHANTGDTLAPNVFGAHKIATGSESGTQSWPHGSVVTSMAIVGVSGVDTSQPLDPNVNGGAPVTIDITAATTAPTIPSVTVTKAGSLLLYILSFNSTTVTAGPPAGWTELVDRTGASTRGWQIAYKPNVAAGATGTATSSVSGSTKVTGLLYVLQPASVSANAGFSGSGTAGFSGQPTIAAPAGFSGVGTLALAGSPTVPTSGAYSGSGTLTLTGKPSLSTAASFSGAGTLTLAGQVGGATVGFSGAGTLSLVATPTVAAAGGFSGAGTLSLAGKPSLAAPAGFSGVGTLSLAGKPTLAAGGAYSGSGTLTLTAKPTQLAGSLFSGVGTLTLDDGLLPPADITAALVFTPTLSSSDRGFNAAAGSLGRPANIARLHVGETTWVGPVEYSPLDVALELAVVPAGSTPTEPDFDPPDLVDGRPGRFLAPSARGTYGVWARDGRGSGSQFAVLTVT
jgi:hypothetical protein